ncbi:hypothetical protein ABT236_22520 [Streptomyces sp. NPDC001523]|uniref:hypothetical protein n=1 Tax=Streptomyces sp. NPDC001523 TaxID=3154383 RepID=UPI00331A7493
MAAVSTPPTDPFAGMSLAEIRTTAYAHTGQGARAKKLRGTLTEDGETISIDLGFSRYLGFSKFLACGGSFTTLGHGKAQIHADTEVVYVKRDTAAWHTYLRAVPKAQADAITNRYADHWVKVAADDKRAKSLSFICGLGHPGFMLNESEEPHIRRGADGVADNQPAITLTYPGRNGATVTDYIAAEGRAYLLKRTETKAGRVQAELSYWDIEAPTPLYPPPADEVIPFE